MFPYQVSGQNLAQWRKQAIADAPTSNLSPEEVDWLLLAVSNLDRLSLRLGSYENLTDIPLKCSLEQLSSLWQRRRQDHVPLQYLVKAAPWRDFSLTVSPAVLIPRPETEEIIDIAVKYCKKSSDHTLNTEIWVDLGTGSGAIALGLAQAFPQSQVYGVDISTEALKIAQKNALNLSYDHRIQFYQGSWWSPLTFLQGKVSGMVSNPPYIPTELIKTLQPEVANHEPILALDGGKDGLDAIRHLVEISPLYLKSGGIWLIEMMLDQGEQIIDLLEKNGNYSQIQWLNDMSNHPRFVLAYRV
ncbi:MAG: peptide chain release factor N(5)-glutamine methyltransferase [Microcystaceae cyanobacterium]